MAEAKYCQKLTEFRLILEYMDTEISTPQTDLQLQNQFYSEPEWKKKKQRALQET